MPGGPAPGCVVRGARWKAATSYQQMRRCACNVSFRPLSCFDQPCEESADSFRGCLHLGLKVGACGAEARMNVAWVALPQPKAPHGTLRSEVAVPRHPSQTAASKRVTPSRPATQRTAPALAQRRGGPHG